MKLLYPDPRRRCSCLELPGSAGAGPRQVTTMENSMEVPKKIKNRPRGMVWGGRWEGASGWGTHVHPWQMHVDGWQNQYNIVELKKN